VSGSVSHRWILALVAVLAVVDVVILGLGYRARGGVLPPWQDPPPAAFTMTAPSDETPASSGSDASGISGPVLLAVNPAGVVLRATRGSCDPTRDNPTRVAVANADTPTAPRDVTVNGIAEVLGVMAFADGRLRLTGFDDSCKAAVTFDSTDQGVTWQSVPEQSTDLWRLDKDTTAEQVIGPGDKKLTTPCVPVQVVNLPARRAIVSCAANTFFLVTPSTVTPKPNVTSMEQLSVAASTQPGHYYVFGASADCAAQLADFVVDSASTNVLTCLGAGKAPLAVATSGSRIVVQLGYDLLASTDNGANFTTIG
jgi:hypothetical protein